MFLFEPGGAAKSDLTYNECNNDDNLLSFSSVASVEQFLYQPRRPILDMPIPNELNLSTPLMPNVVKLSRPIPLLIPIADLVQKEMPRRQLSNTGQLIMQSLGQFDKTVQSVTNKEDVNIEPSQSDECFGKLGYSD